MTAPGIAYWLSLPIDARARPLDDRQRLLIRRTARKTWRYFDTFVTEADGWLPPDNYQEAGDPPRLARRTSPTNIAMGLLSAMAAHDLGYLSSPALAERLDRTLTTLEGLERHEGHFLNWYDTVDAGAAASAVRLDGRQRQPGGGAHRADAGRAGADRRRRRPATQRLGRAGRHRRSVRVGVGVEQRPRQPSGAR